MASCSKTCGYPHHQEWFPTYFFGEVGGWIPWIPKTTKKKLYTRHKQHNESSPFFLFELQNKTDVLQANGNQISSSERTTKQVGALATIARKWQFSSCESIPCFQVINKLSEVQVLMGILCPSWVGATHHKTRTKKGLSFQQGETKALWHSMK